MSNEARKPRQHMGNRGRSVEKAKDFKGTMKKLIKYLAPYKFTFIFGLLAAVFSVAISVIGPKIVGNIITEVAEGFMAKVMQTGGIDFVKNFPDSYDFVGSLCFKYGFRIYTRFLNVWCFQ